MIKRPEREIYQKRAFFLLEIKQNLVKIHFFLRQKLSCTQNFWTLNIFLICRCSWLKKNWVSKSVCKLFFLFNNLTVFNALILIIETDHAVFKIFWTETINNFLYVLYVFLRKKIKSVHQTCIYIPLYTYINPFLARSP